MARIKTNELLDILGGRLGNLVFRSWNGKTFVYCRPGAQNKKKQSVLQKENRQRFRAIAHKTKFMLLNPETKAHYSEEAKRLKLPNAYTVLLKELLTQRE